MAHRPTSSVPPRMRRTRLLCGVPFAWRRVSSGAATMHRLHVMNDGSISTGISMPLSMPNRLSASDAGRPEI